jgi:molybdopterin/thiamine biosynthesis adenylyltransferase
MLGRLNPWVAVQPHPFRLAQHNVDALVAGYDVIVDGSDNIDTRYRLADACERQERPLVVAALSRFDGSLTTFMPYAKNADGVLDPRLRDLFPTAAPAGSIPNCVEGSVIGTAAGILGACRQWRYCVCYLASVYHSWEHYCSSTRSLSDSVKYGIRGLEPPSKAAQRTSVSQPALSASVAKLSGQAA